MKDVLGGYGEKSDRFRVVSTEKNNYKYAKSSAFFGFFKKVAWLSSMDLSESVPARTKVAQNVISLEDIPWESEQYLEHEFVSRKSCKKDISIVVIQIA